MSLHDKTNTASTWKAITASDTAKLEPVPAAVFVGTGGDVVAEGQDGVTATFKATSGSMLMIQPVRILTTSTASDLVGVVN